MKRYIFVAVAALALVACSKNFDHNKSEGQAIGFGTWSEVMTKRTQAASGDSVWENNDQFTVSGYKTNNANKTTIFDNVEVTYSTTTSKWSYTTPRYWDYAASNYVFYAVTPSKVPNPAGSGDPVAIATLDPQTGRTTAASSAITFAGDDSDILVASEKEVTSYGTDVNLEFNHIASLVDLKVKKDAELSAAKVDITGISITNVGNKGTFQITGYDSSTKKPTVTWSTPSTYAGTYDNASGVNASAITLPTDIASNSASALISNLIVLPQTFNSDANIQKIVISYTITDKNGTPDVPGDDIVSTYTDKEIALHLFDKVDDQQNVSAFVGGFSAGVHYTLTLTINAKLITFTASVNNWSTTDATGYGYIAY